MEKFDPTPVPTKEQSDAAISTVVVRMGIKDLSTIDAMIKTADRDRAIAENVKEMVGIEGIRLEEDILKKSVQKIEKSFMTKFYKRAKNLSASDAHNLLDLDFRDIQQIATNLTNLPLYFLEYNGDHLVTAAPTLLDDPRSWKERLAEYAGWLVVLALVNGVLILAAYFATEALAAYYGRSLWEVAFMLPVWMLALGFINFGYAFALQSSMAANSFNTVLQRNGVGKKKVE